MHNFHLQVNLEPRAERPELIRNFFGRIFWEDFFGRNSLFTLNMEGIDLFVKILVFVKILSKWRRKEEGRKNFESLEVLAKAHRI